MMMHHNVYVLTLLMYTARQRMKQVPGPLRISTSAKAERPKFETVGNTKWRMQNASDFAAEKGVDSKLWCTLLARGIVSIRY